TVQNCSNTAALVRPERARAGRPAAPWACVRVWWERPAGAGVPTWKNGGGAQPLEGFPTVVFPASRGRSAAAASEGGQRDATSKDGAHPLSYSIYFFYRDLPLLLSRREVENEDGAQGIGAAREELRARTRSEERRVGK